MVIETTRFGEIEVSEESVLHMADGMLGFQSCKWFVLLEDEPGTPFKWLQAVDDPALAFIVVNPIQFFPEYEIELADDDAESIGLQDPSDAELVTTVTVEKDGDRVTTNLLGPVVINSRNLQAKQVVLQDDRYGTKHVIGAKAGTDATLDAARAA